jgi:hypothetical protein
MDGELDHLDGGDRARFYREKTGLRTSEEVEQVREFVRLFDTWLERVRQGA